MVDRCDETMTDTARAIRLAGITDSHHTSEVLAERIDAERHDDVVFLEGLLRKAIGHDFDDCIGSRGKRCDICIDLYTHEWVVDDG